MYPWRNFWCVLINNEQNLSPPSWNRVIVSEKLGANPFVPVTQVDTSLSFIIYNELKVFFPFFKSNWNGKEFLVPCKKKDTDPRKVKKKYEDLEEHEVPPDEIFKEDLFMLMYERTPSVKDSDICAIDAFENGS